MERDPERRRVDLRRGYGAGSGEEEGGSPERLWDGIRRGGGRISGEAMERDPERRRCIRRRVAPAAEEPSIVPLAARLRWVWSGRALVSEGRLAVSERC